MSGRMSRSPPKRGRPPRNEKNKTILLWESTLKPKKMLLFFINKCQLNFWNQVFSDLTGEEYIADINKNWYIRTCAHCPLLFSQYCSFSIILEQDIFVQTWIFLAFTFAFINNTITFLNLFLFEVVPARNAIRVPENLPQNCSYRTSKSYQSDENTTKMYF